MEWNRVIYADCMNGENGLPTLNDKSVDLGFTDPPWNVDYKGKTPAGLKKFYQDLAKEDGVDLNEVAKNLMEN